MWKGLVKNLHRLCRAQNTAARQLSLSLLPISSAPSAIAVHVLLPTFLQVLRTTIPLYTSPTFLWCERHPHPTHPTTQL